MTCVWTGILGSLTNEDFKRWNISKPHPADFVIFLRQNNSLTPEIIWNGQTLSAKAQDENYRAIMEIDHKTIGNGYLCSTCEPVLFLVSHLFFVDIVHNYMGHQMYYKHPSPKRILKFASSSSHFSRA